MITKQQLIDRKVFKIKDFLTSQEAGELWQRANTCTWGYEASPGRMVHSFDPGLLAQTDMWKRIEDLFSSQASLHRASIDYADHATVHRLQDGDGLSIQICLNEEWRRDWGGYTVLFKSINSNEVIRTVVPEPGSAIIFDQSIWRMDTPIAHWAPVPRFMLTMVCAIESQ